MQNELNQKFNSIDTKFDNIDVKFDKIDLRFSGLEKTNEKILGVLESLQHTVTHIQAEMATKTELNAFRTQVKEEFNEFRSEVQEQFEFFAETAVTKTELEEIKAKMTTKIELEEIKAKMATKEDLLHFTDRFDAKFADLRHDIIQGIRMADKKFLKFAI